LYLIVLVRKYILTIHALYLIVLVRINRL